MLFSVGDKVRCINPKSAFGGSLYGLRYLKKFIVTDVMTYSDGSQELWVGGKSPTFGDLKSKVFGPFLYTRFELVKSVSTTLEYDPEQQGDREDDI